NPSPRSALRSITAGRSSTTRTAYARDQRRGARAGRTGRRPRPRLQRRRVRDVGDVVQRGGQLVRVVADPLGDLDEHVQHLVTVMAEIEQPLRGLPHLRRIALPQALGDLLVPGQVLLVVGTVALVEVVDLQE